MAISTFHDTWHETCFQEGMTSDYIKKIRVNHGWTQETLARKLGVSWRTVARWEAGGEMSLMGRKLLANLIREEGNLENDKRDTGTVA